VKMFSRWFKRSNPKLGTLADNGGKLILDKS